MEFTQFIDLPAELKIQIITKCSPFSYVRLRRTCRFVDELCGNGRNRLRVYCPKGKFYVGLCRELENKDKPYRVVMRGKNQPIKIPLTRDNMVKINKALSGYVFAEFHLNNFRDENYDNILKYFLEAIPEFKVSFLHCFGLTANQVERVMASRWKIGGMKIDCKLEMWKILQIDAVRKMEQLFCNLSNEDNDFSEEEIVQLARGKKWMRLEPEFLSTPSHVNVLKAIAQNWKDDGQFPIWFHMSWINERNYMETDISSIYSEIMKQEACHLGSFSSFEGFSWNRRLVQKNDIWIRKDKKTWQFVRIKRSDLNNGQVEGKFLFETTESTADFLDKMAKFLDETYGVHIIGQISLFEACQTKDMEKIKKALVRIIPPQ